MSLAPVCPQKDDSSSEWSPKNITRDLCHWAVTPASREGLPRSQLWRAWRREHESIWMGERAVRGCSKLEGAAGTGQHIRCVHTRPTAIRSLFVDEERDDYSWGLLKCECSSLVYEVMQTSMFKSPYPYKKHHASKGTGFLETSSDIQLT